MTPAAPKPSSTFLAEPNNAQARMNRAILHFLNGDLKEGWRDYAARTELPGKVPAVAREQRLAAWMAAA
jgi:hypothetical protein